MQFFDTVLLQRCLLIVPPGFNIGSTGYLFLKQRFFVGSRNNGPFQPSKFAFCFTRDVRPLDSDHAGDKITRRSHTGIIIYVNKAPVSWFSKHQNTVESSTFGSEIVALRLACKQIISLRYKLRMFGVPIDHYANVFCDNESVFKNASLAESRLTKKHNSVCFHRVRECVASKIIMPFKVSSDYNLADILTKSLPGHKRKKLRYMIMPEHEL